MRIFRLQLAEVQLIPFQVHLVNLSRKINASTWFETKRPIFAPKIMDVAPPGSRKASVSTLRGSLGVLCSEIL